MFQGGELDSKSDCAKFDSLGVCQCFALVDKLGKSTALGAALVRDRQFDSDLGYHTNLKQIGNASLLQSEVNWFDSSN